MTSGTTRTSIGSLLARRRIGSILSVAALSLTCLGLSACGSRAVDIPDANFRECLNGFLNQPILTGKPTIKQLENMTGGAYVCNFVGPIASIEGAQYLTNATGLSLESGSISDLTPLAGLAKFTSLTITSNQIDDITPLAGLTNLRDLSLDSNQVSDVTPLTGLTNLQYLSLDSNQISDVTPLAGLTNLTTLSLDSNQISDVTPLAKLMSSINHSNFVHLIRLGLSHNRISDVSALAVEAFPGLSWCGGRGLCDLSGQQLAATATVGDQLLPHVVGLGTISWQVTQGDATIDNGMVTYPSAGTVTLSFTDSGSTFAGTVTVTVTN